MNPRAHVNASDLELYVIGALDEVRVAEIDAHVSGCAACEAALMREASLELAFETVASRPTPITTRTRRAVPVMGGVAGALAVAAAALLWIAPAARHASGGGASAPETQAPAVHLEDGSTAQLDGRTKTNDQLDGG